MLKILVIVVAIAFVVWSLIRLVGPGRLGGTTSQPRVIGPDDDPDFLRGLDRHRKRPVDPEDD